MSTSNHLSRLGSLSPSSFENDPENGRPSSSPPSSLPSTRRFNQSNGQNGNENGNRSKNGHGHGHGNWDRGEEDNLVLFDQGAGFEKSDDGDESDTRGYDLDHGGGGGGGLTLGNADRLENGSDGRHLAQAQAQTDGQPPIHNWVNTQATGGDDILDGGNDDDDVNHRRTGTSSSAFPNSSARLSRETDNDTEDYNEDALHHGRGRADDAQDSFAEAMMDGYAGVGLEGEGVNCLGPEGQEALRRAKKKRYFKESAITGIFVLFWYSFSTLLSLYNKWMFSPEYYGFSYPLFVTSCHMVVQFLMAMFVREVWPKRFKPKEMPRSVDYAQKIIPTAVTTGLDIGLSNLSLKTITLSLYTMCKSSTLIFVLGFAFFFHLEQWSLRLIAVIVFISFGVFLMVFNATTVSIPGIVMVFSASALGGLRWALTQLLMHSKEMGMSNPFATIFWLSPIMAIALAMISMLVEGWITMFSSDFFQGLKTFETIGFIVFPGTLAFAMVASEYAIIQRAGVVPLSIAGILKEVTTITISSWVFGDELTTLNQLGVLITVCGIATYSYHKYQKSMQDPDPSPFAPPEEGYQGVNQVNNLEPISSISGPIPLYDVVHVLGDDDEEDTRNSLEMKQRHSGIEVPRTGMRSALHYDGEEDEGLLSRDRENGSTKPKSHVL